MYPGLGLLAAYWLHRAPLPLVRRWTVALQGVFSLLLIALIEVGWWMSDIPLGFSIFLVAALTCLAL